MIRPSPVPSLDRFRLLIADRLGLSFDNARSDALAETLERRSRALSLEAASYLDQLERQQGVAGELSTLGAELTIGETYFFRHTEQMRAFSEVALPERRTLTAGKRPVRILSAGCASGEEAYTLAILASEQGLAGPSAPDILGVDLNPLALKRAERATYSEWALRDTPEATRRRYFRKEGSSYVLLRDRLPTVRFRQANLIEDEALSGGMFDILFCRNVLMYFTRQQAIRTLARLANALLPGGYMFLGHAETLHGLSSDFELCQAHGAFYYLRKTDSTSSPHAFDTRSGRVGTAGDAGKRESVRPSAVLSGLDLTRNWLDVVDRSTQRIQALSEGREPRLAPPRKLLSDPTFAATTVLSKRIMSRLIEAERWDEALEVANRLESAESEPDHMILRAALLTHSGRFESAEQVCLSALARDEANAPAHYILALLRERQGKYEVALEHDQIAADLDPSFAMPKLHLGLSWLRLKDTARARAALTQAAGLLEKEDPWRVLLFGGGFQRSALIQLCERELARMDGGL